MRYPSSLFATSFHARLIERVLTSVTWALVGLSGGIGVVEGGLVATFVGYGSPGATAGAAVLVYRGLTLVGLVGLGWAVAAYLAARSRREDARARA